MHDDERLPVVLLWHMHQPDYRDALSGEYRLPWTLLHAIKDYTDMAAHLEDNPEARAAVNFTPVLIEQLQELAAALQAHLRDATALPDPVLAALADAPLPADAATRATLMGALLRAHEGNLIAPYPAFAALAQWARQMLATGTVAHASDQFLRDLASWYYLAWMGETVKRRDTRIAALLEHSGHFGGSERRQLLEVIAALLAELLRYRRLRERGQVEIAVSPYAHPILPLLLDFNAAREAQPDAPLPQAAGYPGGAERVQWHLQRAVRCLRDCFGGEPHGCWPSEGALSEASLDAIATHGFRWVASGGTVLHGTLHAQRRFAGQVPESQAYSHPGGARAGEPLRCVFRHDTLSDLIGFSYSQWHGDDAVAHFMAELEVVTAQVRESGSGQRLLLIALDGENAWEHYPFNGYYFLRGLYAALANHPRLRLCLMSEALAGDDPAALGRVRAGSWVHGTLATWMGDADKNRGWDLLVDAKQAVDAALASGRFGDAERERILLQLAHCESSDWFWWFGDYNAAESVRDFDELYRHQLSSLYQLIGVPAPAALSQRISVGHGAPEGGGRHAPRTAVTALRLAVFDQRRAGAPLHPTSLHGGLGGAARQFIDWLADGGFSVWQVLPLGPVGGDLSPYWSRADGAINPQFIDWAEAASPVERADEFAAFCREQSGWLDDYALFEALATASAGRPWWQWPALLRDRHAGALAAARERFASAIERTCREQWIAALQWQRVRAHARERGVRLFGDLPIYAAPDSATVWAQREQFQLDELGLPRAVAGVPPDYFSADGQLWGNPLYDWGQAQRDGFAFWRRRMARTLAHFDVVRIDHFRGLCDYWAVQAGATTARDGHWEPAPGADMLRALQGDFPDLPLIAEDLGIITAAVVQLRHAFHLPGMRVMQFGFDGQGNNPHLPHQYERDTVAYSGTHDNDTTLGWYRSLDESTRHRVHTYLRADGNAMPEALLRALLNSVAPLAMLPLQDLLALGSEARFNVPGTASGNWTWRMPEGALTRERAAHWRELNQVCGRCD